MKRKIVNINEALCNGCGSCIPKCAEGALQIVNGKAKIIKETYCDGLGACLGQCPQGAITITEREAPAFSETEVHEYLKTKTASTTSPTTSKTATSQKPQWPIKLNLVPPKAPFFENADILLAADCAPVALKNFHDLMVGKRVIIGCPKFDDARAYAQKLTEIFQQNNIASVTVVHMEVPCCTGLKWAVNKALEGSGKQIPVKEFEVKIGGEIVDSKDKVEKNPDTCPGLRDLLQPKPSYIKCHVCGGDLEIWTDEDKTTCPECGAEWKRPASNAACLEYCQYADKCRGIIETRKK